jgi:DNA (cytosine-5)-methyltransferase 1
VVTSLTLISLFSGAGGFDWGFHRAGYELLLASELLEASATTLARNLQLRMIRTPAVPVINGKPQVVQGDIRQLDFSHIETNPDVLIGGPPCQDFSMVKGHTREGLNGGRGQLYVEFVRAVMFLQPKVFVFENVPGLISANGGTAYETIQSDFTNLNRKRVEILDGGSKHLVPSHSVEDYQLVFSEIVDATRLGVPQTRKRLIMVGLRADIAASIDIEQTKKCFSYQLHGEGKLFRRYPLTTLEIFEGKPLASLNGSYRAVMDGYEGMWNEATNPAAEVWRKEIWNNLSRDVVKDYYLANQLDYSNFSAAEFDQAMREHEQLLAEHAWLDCPVTAVVAEDDTNEIPFETEAVIERMKRIPPDANYSFVDGTPWRVTGKGISFIYRRCHPLKPAWTVVAYGGGGTHSYHYDRGRTRLTLRERARIQTFSDNFQFIGRREEVRAQIGEAVPPLLGEVIASTIAEVIS